MIAQTAAFRDIASFGRATRALLRVMALVVSALGAPAHMQAR